MRSPWWLKLPVFALVFVSEPIKSHGVNCYSEPCHSIDRVLVILQAVFTALHLPNKPLLGIIILIFCVRKLRPSKVKWLGWYSQGQFKVRCSTVIFSFWWWWYSIGSQIQGLENAKKVLQVSNTAIPGPCYKM